MKKYKKNDLVEITVGREKGKTGKILKILDKGDSVVIEKMNMFKKHSKRDKSIIEKESPVHSSNVLLYCKNCRVGVRSGVKILENSKKVRYCKKCNEVFDK